MAPTTADVVVCGAGIAGIAAAYWLAVRHGIRHVALVDERPPLSLTSDKSTEAYRNWWPGPDDAMVRLMNRSIDLLEDLAAGSDNAIRLNRRGYVYATGEAAGAARLRAAGEAAAAAGAGPLRVHDGGPGGPGYRPAAPEGYRGEPEGADLLLDPALIARHFPYLSPRTVALLHARRCGWLSGQQLGMLLLEGARARGARLLPARVTGVDVAGGRVAGVRLAAPEGPGRIATGCFVDAAGPLVGDVARLLGVHLPVVSEPHRKLAFEDVRGAVPRDAPLLIWDDPQALDWDEETRAALAAAEATAWLTRPLPAGAHLRPEGASAGSRTVLALWACRSAGGPPAFPLPEDPLFPELALRGTATLVPGLRAYLDPLPRGVVDGGYYTRTPENRPLVGPLPVEGAHVLGALSGFGLMAACAAAELLAAHVTGAALPAYAPAFAPARYDDPGYRQRLAGWGDTGLL
jgi:glycine/D-amino acid oxidase-like deaminating enzyme